MADENINIILESDDEELDLTNDDGEMILTDDGSAGGGTNDYNKLKNKPSINGVVLQGNRTTEEIFPDLSGKADKRDTVLETTLSHGRRAGSTVGDESLAFGEDVEASGYYSQAFGYETTAIGPQSHAEGRNNTAYGSSSHAEGTNNVVNGSNAHVEGYESTAVGNNAHAEGYSTTAGGYASHVEGGETSTSQYGTYAHAEGHETSANAQSAHAEGEGTFASMQGSHAEGYNTQANGIYAHAEGTASQSNGYGSHAEGGSTKAQGSNSHSEGNNTSAKGAYSHAEGAVQLNNETKTYNGTTYSRGANGYAAHSEGYNTVAHGDQSHAEGNDTLAKAQYSHAEGYGTVASETGSHAEGGGTISSGTYSHSEGEGTHATEYSSHAEGAGTTASGMQAHAEGGGTTASGSLAHAEGGGTTASGGYSHSEGSGTTASGGSSHSEGASSQATGSSSHAEGLSTHANGAGSHAEGSSTYAEDYAAHAEGGNTHANAPMSHAEGGNTIAAGTYSHVGGTMNVEDSYDNWPEWVSGSEYSVGDKVKITTTSGNDTTITAYICKTPNSDTTFTAYKWVNQQGKMNYAEIIGNGIYSRSNARVLDWEGNERLAGNLYVGCNDDSTGGNKVATEAFVTGKIGTANGIASLDSAGKVPSSQLPSYVDDVLEYASTSAFPGTGESGKIYVALDTNKTYRWSGSAYVQISESLALGETEQTAYRGDRGKAAYDHAALKGTAHTAGFYKIGTNSEGHVVTATQVTKNDIVSLGIAPAIVAETASGYTHKNTGMRNIVFSGNSIAFKTARYADKPSYMPMLNESKTYKDVDFVASDGFIMADGTANGSGITLIGYIDFSTPLPIGDYKIVAYVSPGDSVLDPNNNAQYQVRFIYSDDTTLEKNVYLGSSDRTISATTTKTTRRIAVYAGVVNGVRYSSYKVWMGIYDNDVTIIDTNETIIPSETYELVLGNNNITTIDTMQHKSVVTYIADTKQYIDEKEIDIDEELTYVTPERFGAKGDGTADDYNALVDCFTYAIANSIPVRGNGAYRISSGLNIVCDEMDIEINKLITSATINGAMLKLTGTKNKIVINVLNGYSGDCSGFHLYGVSGHAANYNTIHIPYITVTQHAVVVSAESGAYACENEIHTRFIRSGSGDCLHLLPSYGENVYFGGGQMVCPNGWAINTESDSDHFYNFALEGEAKYGIRVTGYCNTFYGFRIAEVRIARNPNNANGTLIKFVGSARFNIFECGDILNYIDVDVTDATDNSDLTATSVRNEGYGINIVRGTGVRPSHANGNAVGYITTCGREIITLRNQKIMTPFGRMRRNVNDDIDYTAFYGDVYATDYVIKDDVTIKFNSSFCCVGFNDIIIDQTDGHYATIYDKFNNVIFNGSNYGTGVYRLSCVCDMDDNIARTLAPDQSSALAKAMMYDGENDVWTVTTITT